MLTRNEGHRVGATVLEALGYTGEQYRKDYPVWLGGQERHSATLVGFGRTSPLDMTTATAVIEIPSSQQIRELSIEISRTLAAPLLVLLEESEISMNMVLHDSEPHEFARVGYDEQQKLRRMSTSVGPAQLLQAKLGHRQLGLFPVDVKLLEMARELSERRLSPLVEAALETAAELTRSTMFEIAGSEPSERLHKQAARIVVGALTALALRDKEGLQDLSPAALADASLQRYSDYFRWLQSATSEEHRTLGAIIVELGQDVDYRSLDPRVLASVYEHSLVTDVHRKSLGTHYTPSGLARQMLRALPIESIRPESRLVLDPTCGSGGLLLAAHDRLRDLQAPATDPLAVHQETVAQLRGLDKDDFAVELTRLSLLLNAYPAGNGWHISQADVLRKNLTETERPSVVVANPPWRNTNTVGARREVADQFLQWMVRMLRPGGLLAVVMPIGWLNSRSSHQSRRNVQQQCDIFEIWRLPETLFESSSMAPAVIFAQKKVDHQARRISQLHKRVIRPDAVPEFYASGLPEELTLEVGPDKGGSPIIAGPLLNTFSGRTHWTTLGDYAKVITGPQPLAGVSQRREAPQDANVLFLPAAKRLPHLDEAPYEALIPVRFPDDFQHRSRRGEAGIGRNKVLVSAARSAHYPWRLRVGIDRRGILVSNSLQMVVPQDERQLYGLMAFLGSTFASAWVDELVPDRNISTGDFRAMPVPSNEASWRELTRLGEMILGSEGPNRMALVARLDDLVWSYMGVDHEVRSTVISRFAGFRDPSGFVRYPAETAPSAGAIGALGRARRTTFGATLDVRNGEVQLAIPGISDEDGVWTRPPARINGWMLEPGSTFAAEVSSSAGLGDASFWYESNSWLSDDELEARVQALQISEQH